MYLDDWPIDSGVVARRSHLKAEALSEYVRSQIDLYAASPTFADCGGARPAKALHAWGRPALLLWCHFWDERLAYHQRIHRSDIAYVSVKKTWKDILLYDLGGCTCDASPFIIDLVFRSGSTKQ